MEFEETEENHFIDLGKINTSKKTSFSTMQYMFCQKNAYVEQLRTYTRAPSQVIMLNPAPTFARFKRKKV